MIGFIVSVFAGGMLVLAVMGIVIIALEERKKK